MNGACIINRDSFANYFEGFAVVGNCDGNGHVRCADTVVELGGADVSNELSKVLSFAEVDGHPHITGSCIVGVNAGPACPNSVVVSGVFVCLNAVGKRAGFVGICDLSVGIIAPVNVCAALTELFAGGVGLACSEVIGACFDGFLGFFSFGRFGSSFRGFGSCFGGFGSCFRGFSLGFCLGFSCGFSYGFCSRAFLGLVATCSENATGKNENESENER